jgi:unsaturated chondroitin disaccharide hydrolase
MTTVPAFVPDALEYSLAKIRQNLATLPSFPEMTRDGKWVYVDNGGWVGGHWVGLLWLAYAHTGDPAIEAGARQWAERLAPRQFDTGTHDLGFLFELSHLLGARLTGDASLNEPAMQAAKSLIQRYNPRSGFIRAWGKMENPEDRRGRAIIDTMMNLDLLFWATKASGKNDFSLIAETHAHTALARQVRADWSTAHCADFDPDTGEFLKQDTHQGLSATSCWSRGQAWAVYGYAECFRETGNPLFLQASQNLARYMIANNPPDHVPFWDYNSPLLPDDVRDSSAGSILASGLLILAGLEPDIAQAAAWRAEAETILASLWQSYTSQVDGSESILIHATRSKPAGHMDHGLIYGDYYFVEALTRLSKSELEL